MNCLDFFNGFCPFTHIIMVWHAAWCVYLIPWPRKYRFRPPNHDLTWSNFRDIGNLRFCGGHFEKWPKFVVSPSFFSGNIANMIPESPLNKTVPLTEDHGGCTGDTPVSSRTIMVNRLSLFIIGCWKMLILNIPLKFQDVKSKYIIVSLH